MSDWMKAADKLNEVGRKMKKAGIEAGYHNHHMEFEKLDGHLIYDALLQPVDPVYVKMQFQVAVISVGYKAADYFKKFPGRFISAHLADWSPSEKKECCNRKRHRRLERVFRFSQQGRIKEYFRGNGAGYL